MERHDGDVKDGDIVDGADDVTGAAIAGLGGWQQETRAIRFDPIAGHTFGQAKRGGDQQQKQDEEDEPLLISPPRYLVYRRLG